MLLWALAGEPDEVTLKVSVARRILPGSAAGNVIGWGDIASILEDEELGLTDDEARQILLASGILAERGDDLVVPTKILPSALAAEGGEMGEGLGVAPAVLLERLEPSRAIAASDVASMLASVQRTTQWAETLDATLPADARGVPCFWDYTGDGTYTPFSEDPGSVTTSDALRLMVERNRVGLCDIRGAASGAGVHLWRVLLSLRRHDGWNRGSFSVGGEDDDFVGAFDPARAASGPCPTTDATAGAVVALCAALKRACWRDQFPELVESSRVAVIDAVGFLFRAQNADGGWPIYRYEDDQFAMTSRDVSSWYACDALVDALEVRCLDSRDVAAVDSALRAYASYAQLNGRGDSDEVHWVPDFVAPYSSLSGELRATALVALSLHAVARALPDLEVKLRRVIWAAATFVDRAWKPDPEALAVIDFRVPTWAGPADTRFPWEWPLDPLIVSMLTMVGYDAGETDLDQRRSQATASFLASESHGHWDDFLMEKEGNRRAVVGSTIFFHRALLDQLCHERRLLAAAFTE